MEKLNIKQNLEKSQNIPSNIEAEQNVLGSVLVNNDIIDEIASIINSNKFYDPIHVKIYEVIENLNNKGMIANPITLKNFLEKNQGLEDVGGVEYLVKLTRFSSSVKQAVDYAKIVHENYVKRELIQISHNIKDDTLNSEDDKSSRSSMRPPRPCFERPPRSRPTDLPSWPCLSRCCTCLCQ